VAGLLFSSALIVCFSLGLILHKTGFKYLPASGGAIMVGLILGCIVRYDAHLFVLALMPDADVLSHCVDTRKARSHCRS
jgi:hypothetical protein